MNSKFEEEDVFCHKDQQPTLRNFGEENKYLHLKSVPKVDH